MNGDGVGSVARYARAVLRAFENQDENALLRGYIAFPKPETEAVAHV